MKYRAITSVVAACLISSLAFANDSWTLDSSTSTARLYQGSKANPGSVNTVVARVAGKVKLDTSNLDNSIFDLSIYPADQYWKHALGANSDFPRGNVSDASGQTLLRFKSKRIGRTGNGQLEVIGNLTLTRVEPSVTAAPSEAYAGAVYGNPVIRADTREIKFQFSTLSAALSGSLTSATLQSKGALEIVGATRVGHEDLAELLSAIRDTNWSSMVQKQDCHMPSTDGEDYSGVQCTGTLIAARSDDHCQMPAAAGEDYSGPLCTPVAGNQTTMVLALRLLPTVPEPSVGMLSENGNTRQP